MKSAIIVSKQDLAGMNIKQNLLDIYPFEETEEEFEGNKVHKLKDKDVKLYTAEKESVFCENIDEEIDADLFIFATKHQSASGVHSLCVHSPGNWGRAEFGGKDKSLCVAPADYLKAGFLKLLEFKEKENMAYEVIQECTHHGPFLKKPIMFIEIGSNEESWQNPKAGEVIAKTIYLLLTEEIKKNKTAFGIGGLHHTPNFQKILLNHDISLAHVCPVYQLENLTKELILEAMEKSVPKITLIILDWKGLKQYKEKVKGLLEELKLEYKRVKEY